MHLNESMRPRVSGVRHRTGATCEPRDFWQTIKPDLPGLEPEMDNMRRGRGVPPGQTDLGSCSTHGITVT